MHCFHAAVRQNIYVFMLGGRQTYAHRKGKGDDSDHLDHIPSSTFFSQAHPLLLTAPSAPVTL